MKEKIKTKVKGILNSDKFPYIVLFFLIVFSNLLKSTSYGDDKWFANVITAKGSGSINSIPQYLVWRYKTWTPRLLIELFLVIFAKYLPFLWRILDGFIYVLFAYSLSKIFVKKKDGQNLNWIVIFLVLCIPFDLIVSAGWIATSLNYSWAVAFGLFSLIPIRKNIDSEKIKKYEYPLYIFACLYACNVEQVCLCLFTVYFIFSVYFCFKKNIKKINIVMILISLISLIFILTCPRK